MEAPPEDDDLGEVTIHVEQGLGFSTSSTFLKVQVANQKKASKVAEPESAGSTEMIWDEDLVFKGKRSVLTAMPLGISALAFRANSAQTDQVGTGRVNLGALLDSMQGIRCGVPIGSGQAREQPPPDALHAAVDPSRRQRTCAR